MLLLSSELLPRYAPAPCEAWALWRETVTRCARQLHQIRGMRCATGRVHSGLSLVAPRVNLRTTRCALIQSHDAPFFGYMTFCAALFCFFVRSIPQHKIALLDFHSLPANRKSWTKSIPMTRRRRNSSTIQTALLDS